MKSGVLVVQILLLTSASLSSSAGAADLGATSQESISISVTIAPGLAVHEVREEIAPIEMRPVGAHHFCITSNAIRTYNVTLLSSGSDPVSSAGLRPRWSWSDAQNPHASKELANAVSVYGVPAGQPGSCNQDGEGNAELHLLPSGSAAKRPNSAGPVTLLIGLD